MVGTLLNRIMYKNIHNEKIAIVRSLLAIGTIFTLLTNNMGLLINSNYLNGGGGLSVELPLKAINLFVLFPPVYAKLIALFILVTVISGYLPQITSVLHALVMISFCGKVIPVDGGDQVALVLSILLIPICITDERLNQWMPNKKQGNANMNIFNNVCLFAIQMQAAFIYLESGIGKIMVNEWKEGTACYYWFSHNVSGAPDWLRNIYESITLTPYVALVSWGVIIFEILLFACLFANENIKAKFLVLAILFHFMIIITHGLPSFFCSMLGLLILYLDEKNISIKVLYSVSRFFKDKLSGIKPNKMEQPVR
ncbi:MAG: hypothetical protein P4L41_08250 [Flavipsychrobacter sp.]|nr:hypothetical protein [Flavipsychrobacter sp.]